MSYYKGIDVSSNNGTVNWSTVKAAGIDFAIIRTGYGKNGSQKDSQFRNNVAGCQAQGIPFGVYHYSYALNAASAKKEATLVLSILNGLELDFPVYFDFEDADGYKKANGMTINRTNATAICKAFVEAIRAGGYQPGIYASKSWIEDYIDLTQLGDCSVWVAHWTTKTNYQGWDLWQYTDSLKIGRKTFDGDYAESLPGHTVTAMQQDASCKAGVIRYAGVKTTVYTDVQLTGGVTTLTKGDAVTYYGNYCTIDSVKYAYVQTDAGQGYVKAADLRMGHP